MLETLVFTVTSSIWRRRKLKMVTLVFTVTSPIWRRSKLMLETMVFTVTSPIWRRSKPLLETPFLLSPPQFGEEASPCSKPCFLVSPPQFGEEATRRVWILSCISTCADLRKAFVCLVSLWFSAPNEMIMSCVSLNQSNLTDKVLLSSSSCV